MSPLESPASRLPVPETPISCTCHAFSRAKPPKLWAKDNSRMVHLNRVSRLALGGCLPPDPQSTRKPDLTSDVAARLLEVGVQDGGDGASRRRWPQNLLPPCHATGGTSSKARAALKTIFL